MITRNSFRTGMMLARRGRLQSITEIAGRRLYSSRIFLGLERDLTTPFEAPEAKLPILIRPLLPDDARAVFGLVGDVGSSDSIERLRRRRLFEFDLPTPYAAVTETGEVCYVQWLIGHTENDRMAEFFRGEFPSLAPDEFLLEYAFTMEQFRGLRIMPSAMAKIAELAREQGGRRVVTFVEEHNLPSLKGCRRAGFRPNLRRRDSWRLGRRVIEFQPLPAGTGGYAFES